MKKKIFVVAAMLMCLVVDAMAQSNPKEKKSPEEIMQQRAESVANKLLLSDRDAAKFIPVYVEYQKANKAIMDKYKSSRQNPREVKKEYMTDKEVEANLRAQFAKSQEVLDLRKAYLDKYLTVISARQIRELYKIEKEHMFHGGHKHSR